MNGDGRVVNGRNRLEFDRMNIAAHPKGVRSLLRRVVSVACVLAFVQGAVAQCAGWQATPQARLDCCRDGMCPLHHREESASRAQITQAVADDCCAHSLEQESGPSATVFASTMTLAVLESRPPVVLSLAPAIPLSAPWETPSPPDHVPKHLLLSVLLV
jgi:hypothetical protein